MDVDQLIDAITSTLTAIYEKDGSAPALLISKLPNGMTYISAVRFKECYGKDHEIVLRSPPNQNDHKAALLALAKKIISLPNITGKAHAAVNNLQNKLIKHGH